MGLPPITAKEITELNKASTQVLAPGEWTPKEAATHVSEAWQNAVESIVETGRRLIEAKRRVGHGQWLPTVELLPFGDATARKLVLISRHPDIANRSHGNDLPASWTTLHVLSQLPEGEVTKRIEAGEITPELERATAQQWVSTYTAAKQETLNAWNQFSDSLTAALSYANTYDPPTDTDIYTTVAEIKRRAAELAEIVSAWEENDEQD
ncbi:MAG: hypothetical protein ACRDQG_12125 [Pseudonocardiaceae bacterium]